MEEQQQQAFTFASPFSLSETCEEDALDFDYQSWIEQSKMSNCFSSQVDKLWMDGHGDNHHREMLQEEDCEMSLRDLSELPLSRAATEEATNSSMRQKKPRRKKTPSMERVGLIIKLFVLSLSRAAAPASGRKKSFASVTATASGNGCSLQNEISDAGNEPSNTQCNSMPIKSYQYCTNRYLQIKFTQTHVSLDDRKPSGCSTKYNAYITTETK